MIVKNIKFVNDKVEVVLENKSFFISKENYIDNPVAINSKISEEKINYLLNKEKVIECKTKTIKLLNRRLMSRYKIEIMLKEEGLSNEEIKEVICSLIRMGLINDEYYAFVLRDSLLLKRKGRKIIYSSLKDEKIKEEIINKVINSIDDQLYLDNFYRVVEKYSKMYHTKSYELKKKMIFLKLKEYGYEDELISELKIENDEEKENENIYKYLNKILKNEKIDFNDYKSINKIRLKLVSKGFSYDIINRVLEEVRSNETN